MRQMLLPIAIVEHHQMIDPRLNVYEICERLGPLWLKIRREAQACTFTLDAHCIQGINERIARSLGMNAGIFRNKRGGRFFSMKSRKMVLNTIELSPRSPGITLVSLGFPRRGCSPTPLGYSVNSRNTA